MARRGISEFVAMLLILVLAVSGGVLIYAYIMGYVGGFRGFEDLGALTVDEVDGNASRIMMYVRNIGERGCNITDAYIDGDEAHISSEISLGKEEDSGGWVFIDEGEVECVYVRLHGEGSDLGPGNHEVKLVSRGNTQLSVNVEVR
ncbi:MAG: hypothetical protein ACLFVP_07145 [Candidatus Bathyarchaeia archaeon]